MELDRELVLERKGTEKTQEHARVITDRDVLALRIVLQMGVLTVGQAYQLVWWTSESKSKRYAERRMSFLTESGFLTRTVTPYSRSRFHRATRSALDLVQSQFPDFCLTTLAPVSTPEIPHSDGLAELRCLIKINGRFQNPDNFWKSDRELRVDPDFPKERLFDSIPDAIWTTKSGKRIAVEYERTRKSGPRILAKAQALDRELSRSDRVFDLVLWMVSPGTAPDVKRVIGARAHHTVKFLADLKFELTTTKGEV